MKSLMRLPAMMLGLLLLFGTTEQAKAQNEDVSLQSFYDELSPYGTWINDPEYGYVWRPDVEQDEFRPYYTNGRWVMTEYGNTWVSNYDWGWAPFHYGRWIYNRYNSWIWIPDTTWGPAWVNWRSGGGYYGWAPMGPTIGIHIGRSYRVPDFCWNFTPYSGIYVNTFPRYYGYRNNNVYIQKTVIINNTYVRNNRTYYTGPRADEIRRYTNRDVRVYNLNRSDRSGPTRVENNTVNIYNPRPSRGGSNDNAAPRNAVAANVRTQVVGRDNTVSSRPARGTDATNNGGVSGRPNRGGDFGSRSEGSISNRPTRGSESSPNQAQGDVSNRNSRGSDMGNRPTRGNADNNNIENLDRNRSGVFGQGRDRSNAESAQPKRVERQRTMEMPQRTERPQTQQAPQRMERPQQAPQRMERGGGEQRSSGSRESSGRESRGGGRPGRG